MGTVGDGYGDPTGTKVEDEPEPCGVGAQRALYGPRSV